MGMVKFLKYIPGAERRAPEQRRECVEKKESVEGGVRGHGEIPSGE